MSDEEKKTAESEVEKLKEESLEELENYREDGNAENEKMINDARERLNKIFSDLKQWTKDTSDPEKIKAVLENSKENVTKTLQESREKAVEISNSESFRKTIDGTKDVLEGTLGLISEGFKATGELLMNNPAMKNAAQRADERMDTLRKSEGLKRGVDAAEEFTNKMNSTIFGGLRNLLDKKDDGDGQQ
ncbi:hypothetical protein [Catenisphaera adipataccumulans]|jgi:uncharacterized protein (UPF0147 family)|uniref:Uncharacterized protein (UPF0147 family) n=1 Tax=Catenisphaera adipataccumulans TaxID=700500 RepID=A0A7W8FVI7_9FIRM|nr:hypothetical protein [Catenisphaera adipataccumulans]MBB5183188.1 uncharacterized protein (UPF0147 family) [Catenisphaera adipataccumulans]